MKSDMTGPALAGLEERWSDYPREDLYNWVRNSQALIKAGHPRATELWNKWGSVMTAWPNLTDDNVESIIAYVNAVDSGEMGGKAVVAITAEETEDEKSNSWVYLLLAGILGLMALLLTRIIGNLNQIAAAKEGDFVERGSWTDIFASKGAITFLLFAGVIFLGYTTVSSAVNFGRQEGYAPDQPIKFSHETHAGLHKIDCEYCHDGARRSKHAVIPATNTCMNCHSAIKNGSVYGTAEITKIYASIGYDPNESKYIEDYDNLEADSVKAIFTKWIGDQYVAFTDDVDELNSEGEKVVEEQWKGIVTSLTHSEKEKVQGPIEWTRIHNLPDHAYFNHSQHVTVGKLECQACHGKVEAMEVVEQHAPLSMGWCINCHRQTEVQFGDNDYYQSFVKYHDELANGTRDKVTVEDIGGLECQKCHY